MTSAVYGYARVSSGRQSLDQQFDALRAAGCTKVFSDKLSGAKSERPGLMACMDQLREADELHVVALDRLGRSTIQVLTTLRDLEERGVRLVSHREQLDLSTPTGRVVAAVMSALAEMELALQKERLAAAREAARARGRQTGRPRVLTDSQAAVARKLRDSGESISSLASMLGCSRATIYRYTSEEDSA